MNILTEEKTIQNIYKQISLKPEFPNVKNIGRFLIKNDITYLLQSGSALEFYLNAKSGEIVLIGDDSYVFRDENESPRYAIYIDDNLLLDTTMGEKEKNISLFNNEIQKEIKIKIILLSESTLGGIGIKSINVISSFPQDKIIKPTEKKKLTIEYVGDSITCGFGNEAKSYNEFFSTKTENFEKSYAFLSAKELDYDYSTVCYSGCGIVTIGNKMPQRYTKINSFFDNKEEWDFEKYHNDIIVINLGTNDFGYIFAIGGSEYIEQYANFLELVRKKNPNAYIICLLGMMGCEELFPFINEAIKLFGDKKTYAYLLPVQRMEDGIGAQFHPNTVSHSKWGKMVAQIIKEVIENNGK